jgi:hypothetical protein
MTTGIMGINNRKYKMTINLKAPDEFTKIFGYADVGTYGLGHSLLAWARCYLWCDTHNVPMLAPSWLHLRGHIGPILRRERDNRMYQQLFHFPGYVTGLRRQYLLHTLAQHNADEITIEKLSQSNNRGLVVFKNKLQLNEETYFSQIVGNGPKIRQALLNITKPKYYPQQSITSHIALHVRMGDFQAHESIAKLRAGARNSRIPLIWYCNMLEGVRKRIGNIPAIVYSDGTDEDLLPLLKLQSVTRSPKQPSISDMLGIGQASLIISSGSGFSAWGTFLADSPRICFPGQRFVRVLQTPIDGKYDLEPECEFASDLNPAFLEYMSKKFKSI